MESTQLELEGREAVNGMRMFLEYVYGTHFTQPTTTTTAFIENIRVNRKLLFSLPIAMR